MKELEHRDTLNSGGVPDCWCLPIVEVFPNVRVIVHQDPKAKGAMGA